MVTGSAATCRLWLVFFSIDDGTRPWSRLLRAGFCHVEAASWFADQERWVHIAPTTRGLTVDLYRAGEFDGRLGQLVEDSTLILRFPSRQDRLFAPDAGTCVGAIKALLGLRSRALSPWQLSRHLLREGAEIVEKPSREDAEAAQGRSEGQGLA